MKPLMHLGVYSKPNKILHPEIYHLKEAMKSAGHKIELFMETRLHTLFYSFIYLYAKKKYMNMYRYTYIYT